MISNNELKRVKSLQNKKFRDELGLFIVEGEKLVGEALASSFEVTAVYRRDEIGEEAMSRISSLSTPSPVLAVVRKPQAQDGAALVRKGGLYLALDSVRDPGNLGTIIRTADWFGVDAVFCSPDTVDVYNPKVIQSTMGAVFRKKIIYCDIPMLCESVTSMGMEVFGTFLDGVDIYREAALPTSGLIVMGNEADGISNAVAARVSSRLYIPSFQPAGTPTAESLNVAVATAVTLSEFRRRSAASTTE